MKSKIILMVLLMMGLVSAEPIWRLSNGIPVDGITNTTRIDVNTQLGTSDFYKYVHEVDNPYYDYKAYFKARSSSTRKHPVAITTQGFVVTQSPQDMVLDGSTRGKTLSDSVVFNSDNQSMTFADQWGNEIDLIYYYGVQELKEEIRIESLGAIPTCSAGENLEIPFKLRVYPRLEGEDGGMNVSLDRLNLADDAEITNTDGILRLTDLDGTTICTMNKPNVRDSIDLSTDINYSVKITRFGNLEIRLLVPCDWMTNANITFPIAVDPDWTVPTADTVMTHEYDGGDDGSKTYDGNTGTWWSENAPQGDVETADNYEWGIRYDLGDTYTVSRFRMHTGWGFSDLHTPGLAGIFKVCDDSECSGESNLLAADCNMVGDATWVTCDPTDADGRYLELQGGVCMDSDCNTRANVVGGGAEMGRFNEFNVETAEVTTTTTTLPQSSWTVDSGGWLVIGGWIVI